jgi:hypothetical protein
VLTRAGFCSSRKPVLLRLGKLLLVGDYPIRLLFLYPKDFGWMVFLGAEPRSVGVALAEGLCDLGGGGITSAERLRDGEAGRATFQLCPGICLTTEEKHGKPQSEQPQDCSLRRLGCLLRDSLGWPAGRRFT